MLSPDQKILFEFVVAQADAQPVTLRIHLFRGLAHSASDKFVSRNFRLRALRLEEAENRCAQLNLKLETK
jgi:hypothetical protein